MSHIKVLCVDDHRLVRAGIVRIIGLHRDITVVAEGGSGEEAVAQFKESRPDVTLMDLQLPGIGGVQAIRQIREIEPAARIIVLTMYDNDRDIVQALRAGAAAYLLKDILPGELIRAIRDVHAGRHVISADMEARVAALNGQPTLTEREGQVLQLLADGLRNKEIAATLGISSETARTHVKSAFAKLKVHDRTAALTEAFRRGLVRIGKEPSA